MILPRHRASYNYNIENLSELGSRSTLVPCIETLGANDRNNAASQQLAKSQMRRTERSGSRIGGSLEIFVVRVHTNYIQLIP